MTGRHRSDVPADSRPVAAHSDTCRREPASPARRPCPWCHPAPYAAYTAKHRA